MSYNFIIPPTGDNIIWENDYNALKQSEIDNGANNLKLLRINSGMLEWSNPLNNFIFGNNNSTSFTIGNSNTGVLINSSGINNIAFGFDTSTLNITGSNTTAVGFNALKLNTISNSTAFGSFSMSANTTGTGNTAIGFESLMTNQTGASNVAIGFRSLKFSTTANNTAVGFGSGISQTTGNNNTYIGNSSGLTLTTGTFNTFIGVSSGTAYTTNESNNILIGQQPGIIGDQQTIRIGNNTTPQTSCFVAGISSQTTTSGVTVYINSSGKLGTVVSSERYKKNIIDMGSYSEKIYDLRPVLFDYKDDSGDLQPGLIAEETNEVYPQYVIKNDDGTCENIQYHLILNMMLNEVIKMRKEINELTKLTKIDK